MKELAEFLAPTCTARFVQAEYNGRFSRDRCVEETGNRSQSEVVIHGNDDLLLRSEIAFRGLD